MAKYVIVISGTRVSITEFDAHLNSRKMHNPVKIMPILQGYPERNKDEDKKHLNFFFLFNFCFGFLE